MKSFHRSFWGSCFLLLALQPTGCVRTDSLRQPVPFEQEDLDACLAYVIDQSGSFENIWEQGGYELFLRISEKFFIESVGSETKIVIAQLSGSSAESVVLFEGRPGDLKSRFQSPEELRDFIRENADPTGSSVYEAARKVTDYLTAMPDVTEKTRLMTVFFSDMMDSQHNQQERSLEGRRMLASLQSYRELGGTLAMYHVDPDETARWRRICDEAGFKKGQYVIESELVQNPLLPTFH